MDHTRTEVLDADAAESVRWEPCPEPSADDGDSLCAACGWPVDDHEVDRPGITARAA